MAYPVKLEVFEGPLDLLLHLIQRAQIDIKDIPIAEITDQYLGYIQAMKDMDLEVASEFVALAATLLAIKIRMLLPRPRIESGDEQEAIDPRLELVQALLEYSAFKDAAVYLQRLEESMAQRWTRPGSPDLESERDPAPLNATLTDLITAMGELLKSIEPTPPVEIGIEKFSMRSAFFRILRTLRKRRGERVRFVDFFSGARDRSEVVVVFLAILELSRQGRLRIVQERPLSEIYLFEQERRTPR